MADILDLFCCLLGDVNDGVEAGAALGEDQAKRDKACLVFILLFAIIIATIILCAFMPAIIDAILGSGKKRDSDQPETDSQDAFGASGENFRDVYEQLRCAGPAEGWAGSSGNSYATQTAGLRDLLGQITELNQDVDNTVRGEAEQVDSGRKTLENVLAGLQLAIPVAESLYFSGPAGPALSYHYQIAMANSSISTGTDTTTAMHENAQQNGDRLTLLAQKYGAALQFLPASQSGESAQPQPARPGVSAPADGLSTGGRRNPLATSPQSISARVSPSKRQHHAPPSARSDLSSRPQPNRLGGVPLGTAPGTRPAAKQAPQPVGASHLAVGAAAGAAGASHRVPVSEATRSAEAGTSTPAC